MIMGAVIDGLACLAMGLIACVLIWRGRDELGDNDNLEDWSDDNVV